MDGVLRPPLTVVAGNVTRTWGYSVSAVSASRWAKIGSMAPAPPAKPRPMSGALAGMSWSLESPDNHGARHDREQVRYWLSRPPAERLAQAEAYRVRVFGEDPFALTRRVSWLPSVVSSSDE